MKDSIKAVVLAAGKSKRMKSMFTKMTHRILGKEIINFLLDSLVQIGIDESNIVLVAGDNVTELQAVVRRNVRFVVQEQQLGTAHALMCAADEIKDHSGILLVTVGDNPYIRPCELNRLIATHREKNSACTFISAVFPGQPPPYGRVIRDDTGNILDVVEEINATPKQLKIREVNSSVYIFSSPIVFPLLTQIDNNNDKQEYYLVDVIKLLKKAHHKVHASIAGDYNVSIGINSKWELQEAQRKLNLELMRNFSLEKGVTFLQPESTTIEFDVDIGQDSIIYPCSYLASGTVIGKNCHIGPFVFLKDVEINDNERISFKKMIGEFSKEVVD